MIVRRFGQIKNIVISDKRTLREEGGPKIVFLGQLRKLNFSPFCKNFHIASVKEKETSCRLEFN